MRQIKLLQPCVQTSRHIHYLLRFLNRTNTDIIQIEYHEKFYRLLGVLGFWGFGVVKIS